MNRTEIEFAVRDLVAKPFDPEAFPFAFIANYNASPVTVSRLKSGQTNKAKHPGDVLWQKHFYFRSAKVGDDIGAIADEIVANAQIAKQKPRFLLVTDGEQVHARDLKLRETLNIEFERLDERADFFFPLAGYEHHAEVEEHPADIKAAKKLKKLYDAILVANPTWNAGHHAHELNLLMTRLLFCLYAEDTGIFDAPRLFSDTVQYTGEDGGDVAPLLDRLFRIMNIEKGARPKDTPASESRFPYVNGSLFEDTVEIPHFNRTARRQLLECGDLDWTDINPDIFGSMIQTIAQDGTRSDLGMHYTSLPNIMKALRPLFLDELNDAFEKAGTNVPKLEALLGRLASIRVFDPACGSGNFLIVAYKQLRELETRILLRLREITTQAPLRLSRIALQHFYGMDVVDFACETAKLSLWIAEHQTNSKFKDTFGSAPPTLPLAKISTIHRTNATTEDWLRICPPSEKHETFVCGNPPYLGAKNQSPEQRAEVKAIFERVLNGDTNIDYVACWFVKLTDYIVAAPRTSGALVATNSICQGEQVSFLWPYVFSRGIHILFAHTSFKWENSASNNAGVACVIVGLGTDSTKQRTIYTEEYRRATASINAYLAPGEESLIVYSTGETLNGFPDAAAGSQPKDGGNLIFSAAEKQRLLDVYPEAQALIRPFFSAEDILYGGERYTLWISEDQLAGAVAVPPIADRLARTRKNREKGGQDKKKVAATPHKYARNSHKEEAALVIPGVSSERRPYLQVAPINPSDIVSHALIVVYSPPAYLFALLSSRMHRVWAHAIGGKLEDRLRYSSNFVYNTFPVPKLSSEQKRTLTEYSKRIIQARAKHVGKSLAWLYNPETMPEDLREVHQELDEYLEKTVYGRTYKDDTHRLESLFSMYARMRRSVENRNTLFNEGA